MCTIVAKAPRTRPAGQRLDGGDRRAARAIAQQRDFADDHARQRPSDDRNTIVANMADFCATRRDKQKRNRRLALPQQHLAGSGPQRLNARRQ